MCVLLEFIAQVRTVAADVPSSRPPVASTPRVVMAPPAARPRHNTHRIPSTVNPRDMVQISGGGDSDNDGAVLSNDDSDQEYVQSEAEDEPAMSAENPRARELRRNGTAARSSRSQAVRREQNYIDRRSDDEEGEYVNESSGDEPEVRGYSCEELWPSKCSSA